MTTSLHDRSILKLVAPILTRVATLAHDGVRDSVSSAICCQVC
jgi:hypothetical protein